MDDVKKVWTRLSTLGRETEHRIYTQLGTPRRLLLIKDKAGETRLSTPLLLAGALSLLLLILAAPLLIITLVGALLLKYEFVIVKEGVEEGPKEPR